MSRTRAAEASDDPAEATDSRVRGPLVAVDGDAASPTRASERRDGAR